MNIEQSVTSSFPDMQEGDKISIKFLQGTDENYGLQGTVVRDGEAIFALVFYLREGRYTQAFIPDKQNTHYLNYSDFTIRMYSKSGKMIALSERPDAVSKTSRQVIHSLREKKVSYYWYKDGVLHRDNDEPAVIEYLPDSYVKKEWKLNDVHKRSDSTLPQCITYDSQGRIALQEWYDDKGVISRWQYTGREMVDVNNIDKHIVGYEDEMILNFTGPAIFD